MTEGVLKSMLLTKLKFATAVFVAVGLVAGAGIGVGKSLGIVHTANAAASLAECSPTADPPPAQELFSDTTDDPASGERDAGVDELRTAVKKLKEKLEEKNKLVDEKNRLLDEKNRLLDKLKKEAAEKKGLVQQAVPDPKKRPAGEDAEREELRRAVAELKKAVDEKNKILDLKNKTLDEKNALIDELKRALKKDEPAQGKK